MKTFFCKNFTLTLALLIVISLLVPTSCNDDYYHPKLEGNPNPQNNKPVEETEEEKESEIIYSLFLNNKDGINYISLNTKGLIAEKDHWDFKMSNIYASSINANTSLSGRLNFIDIEFDSVTVEKILEKFGPKNSFNNKFQNLKNFGMHHLVGNTEGWAKYDMKTHLVTPLPNRTLLLITNDQTDSTKHKLFKIKITSIYENNILNPTIADKTKVPYLNCKFEQLNINIDDLITY